MHLKYEFEMMELEDEIIAVPIGVDANEFHGVIRLNETSICIFNHLTHETTEDEIIEAMEKEYDAPRSVIADDVRKTIEDYKAKGLLV